MVNLARDRHRQRTRRPIERADLLRALRGLTAKQRITIVLRFYEDLTVDETAEAMRCSAAAVKSKTMRGLTSLRQLLSDAHGMRITVHLS